MTTPLPLITALARAGALEQALRLFDEAGYYQATADPAALAVKGRLLKDRALAVRETPEDTSSGGEQGRLLAEAASAYAAADALDPQPYLLINVATLAFLGGDITRARAVAGEVLERLEAPGLAETPYWIAATRAEALLLRGNVETADEALTKAIRLNRDGWSDHASTLRQLSLICAAGGIDASWLDVHRPRPSLHFAGHLGIAPEESTALADEVAIILAEERIGFGYGALAAGADIIIAEALIAKGAALHVILPTSQEAFIDQSVTPYGEAWLPRFEACMAAAASLRCVTAVAGEYEPLATALAGDVAMGMAQRNAAVLQSHALQLLIVDEGDGDYGKGSSTARDGVIWGRTGAAQHKIVWPRTGVAAVPSSQKREGRSDRRLMALLHVYFEGLDGCREADFAAALDDGITAFWVQAKASGPIIDQPAGNGRVFGFVSFAAAANFATALAKADPRLGFPLTIAGHYGLIHLIDGEASGPALATLLAVSRATIAGTTTISDEFAAALWLGRGDIRTQPIGECQTPSGEMLTLYGLSL
jgi:tetratricopeptide (TPR) repeat protein